MKTDLFKKLAEQIYTDFSDVLKLPGERRLGERYVASRTTIRAALQELQESGRLISDARRGHTLVPSAPLASRIEQEKDTVPGRKSWNVVLFCTPKLMDDQSFLNFLKGAIQAGCKHGINLIIKELDGDSYTVGAAVPEQLYSGIEADGYILTFSSDSLHQFLEQQLKPCVALGTATRVQDMGKRRFLRVFVDQPGKMSMILSKLRGLGHRKILFPAGTTEHGAYIRDICPHGLDIDTLQIKLNQDSSCPSLRTAKKIVSSLKDHTALVLPFGSATALQVYKLLLESKVDIPKRLSLIIDSAETDYFVRVFNITTAYAPSTVEGILCMEALVKQLKNETLDFGTLYTHYAMTDGGSLGPAMSPEECLAYDAQNPWNR